LLTCKQLKADTRLASWQLQTAGLEKTGKPDCQLVIEGLERLVTSSLPTIPRSLVAPDKQGPADYYYYSPRSNNGNYCNHNNLVASLMPPTPVFVFVVIL
jgi:hypothetical protein